MPIPPTTVASLKRELGEQAKPWLSRIDDKKIVRLVDYPWGTPMPSPDGGSENSMAIDEIGIILRGQAEVCELHTLNPFGEPDKTEQFANPAAYRPIRLFEPGDVFGDFSFLDRDAFGTQLPSRPFEKWDVIFGGRSYVFLGANRKGRADQSLFRGEKRSWALHNLLNKAMKKELTRVAYIKLQTLEGFEPFLRELYPSSWRRAYTYRVNSNSYNIRHKFVFIGRARAALADHERNFGNTKGHSYGHTVNYPVISPIFIEAIYDAINRLIRDEPVFAHLPIGIQNNELKHVLKFGEIGSPARISRHPLVRRFYFPLGLSNFLMVNYANATRKMQSFYNGIGLRDCRAPVQNPATGYYAPGENENGEKGSPLHFWKKAADLIIASHTQVDPAQDDKDEFDRSPIEAGFNFSCEVMPSFDGRLELFLRYDRV